MKKNKYKTVVVFLVNERNDNDIFAFFPNEKYNDTPYLKTGYSHIGQHTAVHIGYAKESRLATEDEYKDLKQELESIGYNLEVSEVY